MREPEGERLVETVGLRRRKLNVEVGNAKAKEEIVKGVFDCGNRGQINLVENVLENGHLPQETERPALDHIPQVLSLQCIMLVPLQLFFESFFDCCSDDPVQSVSCRSFFFKILKDQTFCL